MRYHVYLIADNNKLLDAVSFAYGLRFCKASEPRHSRAEMFDFGTVTVIHRRRYSQGIIDCILCRML